MQKIVNILNSVFGYALAIILVLIGAFIVGYNAIRIQKANSTAYYKIDTSILTTKSLNNKNAVVPVEKLEKPKN